MCYRLQMTLTLALLSCICAALAAYYWFRSATVDAVPTWARANPDTLNEPVIKTLSQDGWIAGLIAAVADGARWNKRATIWSAIAVMLTAMSSVSSALGF